MVLLSANEMLLVMGLYTCEVLKCHLWCACVRH